MLSTGHTSGGEKKQEQQHQQQHQCHQLSAIDRPMDLPG